jgi:hypothetical protein
MSLKPESIALAQARQDARRGGFLTVAEGGKIFEIGTELLAMETAGEPLPVLDDASIARLMGGGSCSLGSLLRALQRQQARQIHARAGFAVGQTRAGADPQTRPRGPLGALSGTGPNVEALRKRLGGGATGTAQLGAARTDTAHGVPQTVNLIPGSR